MRFLTKIPFHLTELNFHSSSWKQISLPFPNVFTIQPFVIFLGKKIFSFLFYCLLQYSTTCTGISYDLFYEESTYISLFSQGLKLYKESITRKSTAFNAYVLRAGSQRGLNTRVNDRLLFWSHETSPII